MFTGIIQSIATIDQINDHDGVRTLHIDFPEGFCEHLEIGASISIDGVCLTVTKLINATKVAFDVMLQSLRVTTLGDYQPGQQVNAERAAKDGAEIGGHPLSGHIDFSTSINEISLAQDNFRMRINLPSQWQKYIFAKGYIAINGASLTIAEVDKKAAWFEVWLIPETLRATVFSDKTEGQILNIEIERSTQVIVDTVRDTLAENLGDLFPILEKLLSAQDIDISTIASTAIKPKEK